MSTLQTNLIARKGQTVQLQSMVVGGPTASVNKVWNRGVPLLRMEPLSAIEGPCDTERLERLLYKRVEQAITDAGCGRFDRDGVKSFSFRPDWATIAISMPFDNGTQYAVGVLKYHVRTMEEA